MSIETSCCFCGHRPQHLPWGYDETNEDFLNVQHKIEQSIKLAIQDGYINFITGMALGADMMCAEIVLKLKKTNPLITLECAIPCKNQNRFWPEEAVKKYKKILKKADKITYTFDGNYFTGCMNIRNNYMLDNSNRLIAIYSPSIKSGGTFGTINRAQKLNKQLVLITV